MRNYEDQRIYGSFEEFEREELRRMDGHGTYDEVMDDMLIDEFDSRSLRSRDDDDDEE